MVTLDAVYNSNNVSAAGTNAATSAKTTKDQFLQILVAQLKNQDPLEPMKPDQLLTQLSQLTQVEQLQNISSYMEDMKKLLDKGNPTQWLSTIGKKIGVGDNVLSNGDEVYFKPQSDFDKVVLTLTNQADGSTQNITFNPGDTLMYRNDTDANVTFTLRATKNGTEVGCTAATFRIVRGIQVNDEGTVLVAGNGDYYSVDKVKQIKE